ncbi:MAG: NHL/RHS/YD repeat protein [Candidatus Woesebacteria bacterium GW2011_GWB1_39_12]|uniref:NHL/RHS/YD repeat protein n=2 Tax=Candidatus Woeseibacteriota TaxID=1752722 RepID=A0A0G0PHQ6_9BACT|nr:MAG: NHL/RHS/YD repeat protein [Candidatus Woesebacteria bacterium GW2011_GWA1_39_12]KKR01162.1 MAG: NHL/RHS/YD repeat protein [Candidatus Woesebacteria bacterium GW2011_GWB1_39_12]
MLTKRSFILSLIALWLVVAFLPYVLLTPISVNAQTSSNTVDFLYDGSGQRIYKGGSGEEHTYYISPDLEIIVKPDGTYSYRKNYSFSGKLVAVRDNSGGTGQVNYIHQDHLGSTNLVTSEQGTVVSQQVYYPYGSTRLLTTNNQQLITDRQYTGQVSDQDTTGLYYYNARYYNPTIAKFTQADPVNDRLNRYGYVGNNPIGRIDPTGTQTEGSCDWMCWARTIILDLADGWGTEVVDKTPAEINEMWEDPNTQLGLYLGTYWGAAALGGPVAEIVDAGFCAANPDPSCVASAMIPGPNIGRFDVVETAADVDNVYDLTGSILAARGKHLNTYGPHQTMLNPVTGWPVPENIGGFASQEGINLRRYYDIYGDLYHLQHEYQHLIDLNQGITSGYVLEVRARRFALLDPYPLGLKTSVTQQLDWFERQVARGVDPERVNEWYLNYPNDVFQIEMKPYMRERLRKLWTVRAE